MSAKSISARNRAAKLKAVASAAEGFQAAYWAVRQAHDKAEAMRVLRTAAVRMLDTAARYLKVLHYCASTYGASAETDELVTWVRRWAAMPEAERHDGVAWDGFSLEFELGMETQVGAGAPDIWIGTLHHWADEESLIGGAQADTAARHTAAGPPAPGRPARKKGYAMSNDSTRKAAVLREVAEALRAWGKLGGAKSPETCDAARTALDLATRHLDIIMAASNAYGRNPPTGQALEWLQEMAAARGHTDLGKYWGRWSWFTQPHLCGSPVPVRVSDDLERWADELEKAETVPAPRHEGADVPESDGKTAARPRKPNLAETFILAVFQDRPEAETRKYLKAAAVYAAVKEKHPDYDRRRFTIERALIALAKAGTLQSKPNSGYRLPPK